jgi:putative transcriptional regulator
MSKTGNTVTELIKGADMISYRPLWKTLIDKDIKKTQLMNMVGFSTGTLSRLSKNQYVEMKHIDGICQKLGCKIEDVIEIQPDSENVS